MQLDQCLPDTLRVAPVTITPITAGLSGAGVYRVGAGEQTFVLKVSRPDEPVAAWHAKLRIRQLAGDAGVTPRIVHADVGRRSVVTEFVVDRSFPAFYGDPRTRDAAVAQLGQLIRSVHDLPAPDGVDTIDPRHALLATWSQLGDGFSVPGFAAAVIEQLCAEAPPPSERLPVLSHNDVNPTNVVYDGERLQLLDWDTAGRNDPLYDLAAIAMFVRMDADTCRRLMSAYDGESVSEIPARFSYNRRLVAALCGATFLQLARTTGHSGATTETLDSAIPLGELYQRMRSGAVTMMNADGRWQFGLALIREAVV
ncbi:MAG: phosphotransferase family protein [Kofleriaceae bacterium]